MQNDNEKRSKEKDGLFIPNRQLSWIASGALSLAGFVFLSGYFLGKTQVVEPYIAKVEQDSFADQIYSSVCAFYDQDPTQGQENTKVETTQAENDSNNEAEVTQNIQELVSAIEMNEKQEPQESWYAQLIGYGKEQTALTFAQKLQQKGFNVSVKVRNSFTAKGSKRQWYQVVTESFGNKQELQTVVDKIAHQEKLKGVQIKSC